MRNHRDSVSRISEGDGIESKKEEAESSIHGFESYLQEQRRLKSQRIHDHRFSLLEEEEEEEDKFHEEEFEKASIKRHREASMIESRAGSEVVPMTSLSRRETSEGSALGGRRQALVMGSSSFHQAQEHLADDDDDSSFDDHPNIPFYSRPVQRQRWGDDQVLPHINWGDLFFDLFYVAAAYNLGSLLISSMNSVQWPRGIVYFVGIFGSLYNCWENAMVYASRYTVVDYAHRLFEAVRFFFVALAVLHIKPLELLSDRYSIETFCLVLSLFLESMMHLGLMLELYWFADGDRIAIENHTRRKIVSNTLPTSIMYLTATIIAAVLYWTGDNTDVEYGYGDKNETSSYGGKRLLGATDEYPKNEDINWNEADVPLILCFAGYILNIVYTIFRKVRLSNHKKVEDIRDHFVPSNIDYMIHRYGEWTMLMFGESVLSLLIVETSENDDYYVTACLGILTVIVLQALKFGSEPSHADSHALWRNMRGQMAYGYTVQLLSVSLIAFGVSFKVFLTTIHTESQESEGYGHRLLAALRVLAAVPTVNENAAAALYCGALTVVLISLELMLTTHRGARHNWKLLFHDYGTELQRLNWPLVILCVIKLGLFCFAATLSQWETDPNRLTAIGFFVVAALALSRIIGWGLVHKKKEINRALSSVVTKVPKKVSDSLQKRTSSFGAESPSRAPKCPYQFGRSLRSKKTKVQAEQTDSTAESVSETKSETTFLAAILDTSFDAIVVTDDYGIIKEVNETAISMFGYDSVSEVVGQNVSIFVGKDHAAVHDEYVKTFREQGRTSVVLGKQRVTFARRKGDKEFPCIVGIKKIPNSDFVVAYVRDITPTHGKTTDQQTDSIDEFVQTSNSAE